MTRDTSLWRQQVRHIDLTKNPSASPDLLMTEALLTISHRITQARKLRVPLALITGSHGVGKSTSLREYANTEGLLMWEARPGYQAKHVLSDLAEKLGLSAGTGWRMQTSIVAESLAADPRCVILDEAQRLDYNGFDLLKYLADSSGSTFVLAASPSLEKRIDRWQDIASRCPVRVRVAPMSAEEFVRLYDDSQFAKDTLAAIHEVTAGVLRKAQWLILHIDDAININLQANPNADISRGRVLPEHVKSIAREVLS
jgi:DNA transposition AAA+ family ATPase